MLAFTYFPYIFRLLSNLFKYLQNEQNKNRWVCIFQRPSNVPSHQPPQIGGNFYTRATLVFKDLINFPLAPPKVTRNFGKILKYSGVNFIKALLS